MALRDASGGVERFANILTPSSRTANLVRGSTRQVHRNTEATRRGTGLAAMALSGCKLDSAKGIIPVQHTGISVGDPPEIPNLVTFKTTC